MSIYLEDTENLQSRAGRDFLFIFFFLVACYLADVRINYLKFGSYLLKRIQKIVILESL